MTPECPACRKLPETAIIRGATGEGSPRDIVYCDDCGIGVTSPAPTREELEVLYSAGAYRSPDGSRFGPLVESFVSLSRNLRRRRVEKFRSGGRLLDIGCGRGLFLEILRRHGWTVAGVEFNEETAGRVRDRYGIDVRTGEPGTWGFPEAGFDVITMNHVLEHLPAPGETLEECGRLLGDGGLLVVSVPNIKSLQASAGGSVWFHLDPPRHLHHYTETGLAAFLRRYSFDVVRIRRFDLEYNPFGWLQTLLNVTGIRKDLLFDFLRNRDAGSGSASGGGFGLLLSFFLLPLCVPLAAGLSVAESLIPGRSGTFEMVAVKCGPPPPREAERGTRREGS